MTSGFGKLSLTAFNELPVRLVAKRRERLTKWERTTIAEPATLKKTNKYTAGRRINTHAEIRGAQPTKYLAGYFHQVVICANFRGRLPV
jgi:hypothetical protein